MQHYQFINRNQTFQISCEVIQMRRKLSAFLLCIFALPLLTACKDSSLGASGVSSAPGDANRTPITGEQLEALKSDKYTIREAVSLTKGDSEHTILDDFEKISFDLSDVPEEERDAYFGVYWNDNNEPFYYFLDPDDLAAGTASYEVLHYSPYGIVRASDMEQMELWAERTAAQKYMRDQANKEMEAGLTQLVKDTLREHGLSDDQTAGALVRSIASLDTKGDICSAIADGKADSFATNVTNYLAQALLSNYITGNGADAVTSSWGDQGKTVADAIKNKDYPIALREMVKTVEKNMFPVLGYMEKVAKLTEALAKIWENDSIEEQYRIYEAARNQGAVGDSEWDGIAQALQGAAYRMKSHGVTMDDLRKSFEDRYEKSGQIREEAQALRKRLANWRKLEMVVSTRWRGDGSGAPSIPQRLSAIARIREMLRELLTKDGKLQKGSLDISNDEDFLDYIAERWIYFGTKNRQKFYDYLSENGISLPKTVAEHAEYVWVLTGTKINRTEDVIEYLDTVKTIQYRASKTDHTAKYYYREGKKGAEDVYERSASFRSTCTAAPSMVPAGQTIYFDITCVLEEPEDLDLLVPDWSDYADLRKSGTSDGTMLPASDSGKPNYCLVRPLTNDGTEPEMTEAARVSMEFPAKAETGDTFTLTFNGSGSQTVWTYKYRALYEGKPHHWERIDVIQHTQPDSYEKQEGLEGYTKYTSSETEHGYQIMAQQDHLNPKRQLAAFKTTCTVPPEKLQANEPFSLTLTCSLIDTNSVDWLWFDDAHASIDVPWLEYGMKVAGTDLQAAENGKPNWCSVDPIGNPDGAVPQVQVVGALGEGTEEYELKSVYFSGSGSTTEWVYQWVPDDK